VAKLGSREIRETENARYAVALKGSRNADSHSDCEQSQLQLGSAEPINRAT